METVKGEADRANRMTSRRLSRGPCGASGRGTGANDLALLAAAGADALAGCGSKPGRLARAAAGTGQQQDVSGGGVQPALFAAVRTFCAVRGHRPHRVPAAIAEAFGRADFAAEYAAGSGSFNRQCMFHALGSSAVLRVAFTVIG